MATSLKEIFGVALTLRLALLAAVLTAGGPAVVVLTDSQEYLELAGSLAAGSFSRSGAPEVFRLPGYPLLLLPGLLTGHPVIAALLLQAVLGSLIPVLAYAITRRLAGARAARWAGLLCAAEPVLLAWGVYLMAETLLTLCVGVSVYFAVRYAQDGSPRELLGAGLAACAAAYVKPVAIGFPLFLGLMLLVGARFSTERSLRQRHAVAFLLACTALLAAWPVRNGLLAGYWGFTRQFQHVAAASAFVVAKANNPAPAARAAMKAQLLPPGANRGLVDEASRRRSWETLRGSWTNVVANHFEGTARLLFSPGATAYFELMGVQRRDDDLRRAFHRDNHAFVGSLVQRVPVAALAWLLLGAANAALFALAAFGLTSQRVPAAPRALLAGCVLYFAIAGGGPWSQSRFRAPVMPMVCVLAGLTLAQRVARRYRFEPVPARATARLPLAVRLRTMRRPEPGSPG